MSHKKKPLVAALIFFVILLGAAIGVGIYVFWPEKPMDYRKPTSASESSAAYTEGSQEPSASTEAETLAENPIDFAALQEENPDIYAWITVPNTAVDHPIVQAGDDKPEDYYLHRNIDGGLEYRGSIYTQKANAKDFSDPVTVIYGHNMLDESMFSTLHYFRDPDFFAENDRFYIYTPGHILTYEIVSAYQYDARHILNSFDFSKEEVFREYLDGILAPQSMIAAVREGITLTTSDRIVTLSTCISHGHARYLVQGVLISDEPTD